MKSHGLHFRATEKPLSLVLLKKTVDNIKLFEEKKFVLTGMKKMKHGISLLLMWLKYWQKAAFLNVIGQI